MLRLYNSLSGQIEDFIPLKDGEVRMYVCGPTVYDNPHLGHARCYITWDVLYRYLKFKGLNVKYCRNVTDVDDKILNKSEKENKTPAEITEHFYKVFKESMNNLNVLSPDIEPFATKTLGEMISIVKTLVEKGNAYEVDGNVYFRVKSFSEYGKLSKQPLESLENGVRIDNSEHKENPLDFALWKKDEKHGYNSPWGVGRPGWHIECSAMARKHLGTTIDIHAGGADLIFPHHENEIAQSECANGCTFARYWMHNGFVTINNEKMSKSLGNFLTIDDLLKNYDANTIRLFILTNHYRMPVEFCDESLMAAQNGVKRLKNAIDNVIGFVGSNNLIKNISNSDTEKFTAVMDEDLNTSVALSVLFDVANKANKAKADNDKSAALDAVSTLVELSGILGFNFSERNLSEEELTDVVNRLYAENEFLKDIARAETPAKTIEAFIAVRNDARKNKNWELADNFRKALAKEGIILKDGQDGTVWSIEN